MKFVGRKYIDKYDDYMKALAKRTGHATDRGKGFDSDSDNEWKNKEIRSNIAKTSVTKMRSIKRKTFFGAGKLHEIALHIKQNNIDCVFINSELTSL